MRGYTMNKDDYLKRLRRIEGQVRGLQRMVDEDVYCIDVLTQVERGHQGAAERGRRPARRARAPLRSSDASGDEADAMITEADPGDRAPRPLLGGRAHTHVPAPGRPRPRPPDAGGCRGCAGVADDRRDGRAVAAPRRLRPPARPRSRRGYVRRAGCAGRRRPSVREPRRPRWGAGRRARRRDAHGLPAGFRAAVGRPGSGGARRDRPANAEQHGLRTRRADSPQPKPGRRRHRVLVRRPAAAANAPSRWRFSSRLQSSSWVASARAAAGSRASSPAFW